MEWSRPQGFGRSTLLCRRPIAPDCFAYVQVSAGGQLSNGVTIAIAPAGQTSCSTALSPSTLSKLDSGPGNVTMAGLNIGQLFLGGGRPAQDNVGGVINKYTAAEFLIPYSGPKLDACRVLDQTSMTRECHDTSARSSTGFAACDTLNTGRGRGAPESIPTKELFP